MTTMAARPLTDPKTAVSSATKPNGPALAAFLASGIGTAILGLFTLLAQIHSGFKGLMDLDKNFGFKVGVGPLSGKTIYAVLIWLVAWAVLAYVMRGKSYNARTYAIWTFALIGIGLLGTFPLFFENFPVLQK